MDYVAPRSLKNAPHGTEVPIIRGGGMGDVLMLTIPLRDLARERPGLRFIYATSRAYVPLLRDCDFLAGRTALEDLRGRFPYAIDMRGYSERNGNEKQYRIDVYSNYLVSRPPSSYTYPLYKREEERERGFNIIGGDDGRPILGINLRASMSCRDWPRHYQGELAQLAAAKGWRTVLLDGARSALPPGMEGAGTLNLTGKLDIQTLMCVLQALDVLVSPDTGTTHLAEALNVRTVALFSSIEPDVRLRHYKWMRALWAGLPCSPCYHQNCDWEDPKPCTLAISPAAVMREVEYVAEHNPPWELEPAFEVRPVNYPFRQPLKRMLPKHRPEPLAVGA
jgi:hypothetical protein